MVCAGRRHQVLAANWNIWFLQNWYQVIQSLDEILMLWWSTGHNDKCKLKVLCSLTDTWAAECTWSTHYTKVCLEDTFLYTMPGTHTNFSLANQGTLSFNSQVTQGNVRGSQNWSVTLWPWPSSSLPMGAFRESSHDICGLILGAMSFLLAGFISIRNFQQFWFFS